MKRILIMICVAIAVLAALFIAIWLIPMLRNKLIVYYDVYREYNIITFLIISYVSSIGCYALLKRMIKAYQDNKWRAFVNYTNIIVLIIFYLMTILAFATIGPQNILMWIR